MSFQIPATVEIWDHILESVDTEDKLALATTCSVLHPIVQASLWRHIELEVHSARPKLKILKTLAKKPALGALVRTLDIRFIRGEWDAVGNRAAGHRLLRRLSSLCDMRVLTLMGFVVDDTFGAIVAAQWRQLSSITLAKCIVGAGASQILPETLAAHVKIAHPQSMEGWSIVAHPGLQKFEFVDITTDPPSERECFTLFLPASSLGSLTELILDGNIEVDLAPFLKAAPRLRRLTLPHSLPHIEIPPDVFGELEYIQGYADDVAPFVHGRPIRAAHILLRATSPPDALRLLEQSATVVTDLHITKYSAQDFAEIMEHAPTTLRSLSLGDEYAGGGRSSSRNSRPTSSQRDQGAMLSFILGLQPNMVSVSLVLPHWYCDFAEEALPSLAEEFPHLREVRAEWPDKESVWRRTPEAGEWTPTKYGTRSNVRGTDISDELLSRSLWVRGVHHALEHISRAVDAHYDGRDVPSGPSIFASVSSSSNSRSGFSFFSSSS